MILEPVTVSGSVGKQVYAITADPIVLRGVVLSPLSANAFVQIRDGNASGTIRYRASCLYQSALSGAESNGDILPGRGMSFNKGMHVKVLGTGAVAYLLVD